MPPQLLDVLPLLWPQEVVDAVEGDLPLEHIGDPLYVHSSSTVVQLDGPFSLAGEQFGVLAQDGRANDELVDLGGVAALSHLLYLLIR